MEIPHYCEYYWFRFEDVTKIDNAHRSKVNSMISDAKKNFVNESKFVFENMTDVFVAEHAPETPN